MQRRKDRGGGGGEGEGGRMKERLEEPIKDACTC